MDLLFGARLPVPSYLHGHVTDLHMFHVVIPDPCSTFLWQSRTVVTSSPHRGVTIRGTPGREFVARFLLLALQALPSTTFTRGAVATLAPLSRFSCLLPFSVCEELALLSHLTLFAEPLLHAGYAHARVYTPSVSMLHCEPRVRSPPVASVALKRCAFFRLPFRTLFGRNKLKSERIWLLTVPSLRDCKPNQIGHLAIKVNHVSCIFFV